MHADTLEGRIKAARVHTLPQTPPHTTRIIPARRLSARDKAEFCTQLSVLLQSRVSLHRSLEVLARQSQSRRMKAAIERLGKDVRSGYSFSQALAAQPVVFDKLFVATAEVGQETGRLGEVLSSLAIHLEKINAVKRKVMQAMTYPALVIAVAVAAVALLVFIVPTFAEMFRTLQVELPLSTRIVMEISAFLGANGHYLILGFIVIAFAGRSLLLSPEVNSRLREYSFGIPFLGEVLRKSYVARFCRTLGTLLQAQVSLVDALEIVRKSTVIRTIKDEIGNIIRSVKRGGAIADRLLDSKVFPPMVAQMIAVGEETSELDAMLLKVADYYEKDLDGTIEALSSLIEPVIILLLGGIVGAILISMYLPMFDLVNVVGMG